MSWNLYKMLRGPSLSLLQPIFTYFLTKPALQSSPTIPSSIRQPFYTCLFLHSTISIMSTKNAFSLLSHSTNSGCVKSHMGKAVVCVWPRESCVYGQESLVLTDFVLVSSRFFRSMERDKSAHNLWFLIAQIQKTGIL